MIFLRNRWSSRKRKTGDETKHGSDGLNSVKDGEYVERLILSGSEDGLYTQYTKGGKRNEKAESTQQTAMIFLYRLAFRGDMNYLHDQQRLS